jgi:hypothetical protein
LTHAELVTRAARWLSGSRKCVTVLTECSAQVLEEAPDAIGWTCRGHSVLVECKTSVSDFYADRTKPSRRRPEFMMGAQRYYLTTPGLLCGRELPEGWGLLEVHPRGDGTIVKVIVETKGEQFARSRQSSELALLAAELRRVTAGWRQPGAKLGVFVSDEELTKTLAKVDGAIAQLDREEATDG